jgi:hypothetical protein
MAGVKINSGAIDATDFLRNVPQSKWYILMQERRMYLGINLPSDCRRLLEFVEDAEQMYRPLGFNSPEDFIERGLELNPQDVAWAVDGLRRMKPDEAIPFEKAKALGKHGANQHTVGGSNTTSLGRGVDYTLARLDRDGHDELAGMVRNKTISANAASIKAGYRKRKTPLDRLNAAWAQATEEEREQFMQSVQS